MEGLLPILLYGGLFFLMMKFGCGSHMFGHAKDRGKKSPAGAGGGGCCGGGKKEKKEKTVSDNHNQPRPPLSDADPVCGQVVSTDEAKTSLHDGLVYFFCSTQCREVFEASPEKYAEQGDGETPPLLEQRTSKESDHA